MSQARALRLYKSKAIIPTSVLMSAYGPRCLLAEYAAVAHFLASTTEEGGKRCLAAAIHVSATKVTAPREQSAIEVYQCILIPTGAGHSCVYSLMSSACVVLLVAGNRIHN